MTTRVADHHEPSGICSQKRSGCRTPQFPQGRAHLADPAPRVPSRSGPGWGCRGPADRPRSGSIAGSAPAVPAPSPRERDADAVLDPEAVEQIPPASGRGPWECAAPASASTPPSCAARGSTRAISPWWQAVRWRHDRKSTAPAITAHHCGTRITSAKPLMAIS